MTENYLTLLEESLQQKIQVMDRIQEYNLRQRELFSSEQVQLDKFDEYVEEKGALIDELSLLDSGFESLYEKVSEEIGNNRAKYADQIKRLQELVTKVTDSSVIIQAQEARNKKLVEEYFSRQRMGIKKGRASSKAAYDYYRSMNNPGAVTSQMFDDKK